MCIRKRNTFMSGLYYSNVYTMCRITLHYSHLTNASDTSKFIKQYYRTVASFELKFCVSFYPNLLIKNEIK